MRADDWIIDFLVNRGVTDVFGIPGVVVMDFLYAVDRRKTEIAPHLTYHEQGGAFAACGYAQSTGKLGVAYSTRGPGLTNMITAIADAYYDSVPTMFITAHSTLNCNSEMRVMNNQEIDTVSLVESITKKAVRIDDVANLQKEVASAYREAVNGRKGPVFLDIYSGVFSKEVLDTACDDNGKLSDNDSVLIAFAEDVKARIKNAKKPIILIGNGVRGEKVQKLVVDVARNNSIPILSSRVGQDIVPGSCMYYGFVGSRATRYSNFILSKADLLISVGNRMSFPMNSKSFRSVVENSHTIRVDIDNTEFHREIPNSTTYELDVESALEVLNSCDLEYDGSKEWIYICNKLKTILEKWDSEWATNAIGKIISLTSKKMPLACDVGNHGFWVTTAYSYVKAENKIMYSGSFGTLGSALPKTIGAHYATKQPAICFTGDQGVQFNIQELQYISNFKLPITIVVLNNSSSGMIMEREIAKHGEYLVHTTLESGYSYPEFKKLAECYSIGYKQIDVTKDDIENLTVDFTKPSIIEVVIDKNTELRPSLMIGKPCQDLSPELPRELFEELDGL